MTRPKKVLLLATVFCVCILTSLNFAEEDKYAKRNAVFYKYMRFSSLVKGGSVEPHWMADKNTFWYAEGFPDKTVIYRVDPKANTKESLTTDGIKDCEYDVEGAKWSPDSFKVAVYKIDQRSVPRLPLVHWLKPVEEVEWVHFTKAGGLMPQAEIFHCHC